MRPLKRRDFLIGAVAGLGGLAAIKVGGRALLGAAPPSRDLDNSRLKYLSPRQEATLTAAALAFIGPSGEAAYDAGEWDPALGFDGLLEGLAPDQRDQILLGVLLFEEWTPGLTGFSSWDRDTQRSVLAAWRTSTLGLKCGIWGFLHAGATTGFSQTEAGWRVMGFPGPQISTGRPPGQTATFEWDEAVP